MTARVGVVVFPGTNCEHDVVRGPRGPGRRGRAGLAPADRPRGVDAVVLPGGFAHGDYLRPGRPGPLLPGDGGGRPLRRRRRPGGGHLQRLPGPDRGRAPARRPAEEPPTCASSAPPWPCGWPRTARSSPAAWPVGHRAAGARSTTSWAATCATRPPWTSSRPRTGWSCATSRTPTARSTTSPGSPTRRATWSGSCPTPSGRRASSLGSTDGRSGCLLALAASARPTGRPGRLSEARAARLSPSCGRRSPSAGPPR